jgi:hypothetical protein
MNLGHDADRAFEWLERAYQQRDTGLPQMQSWPLLRNLHGDARWRPFLEKIGLAERRAQSARDSAERRTDAPRTERRCVTFGAKAATREPLLPPTVRRPSNNEQELT